MSFSTPMFLEQHCHGAYGIDFNSASSDEINYLMSKLFQHGVWGIFPTLVTDSIENIKRQIEIIKQAAKSDLKNSTKILGIHLEGIFINPLKKGIHNQDWILEPNVKNYKLIEDDFIKIVTMAPELDKGLIDYLKNKNIKIQAGHCVGGDLSKVDGATHIFNGMAGISHRAKSAALTTLIDDSLFSEIICDFHHVNEDAVKLFFKSKPNNKVILISDSLPITNSDLKSTIFAGSEIFYDGQVATSTEGTIAGSTDLLDSIVKKLCERKLFKPEYVLNTYYYHNLQPQNEILWNDNGTIAKIYC